MSEKDNVHVSDEIGNILLLDFLRKYRGSPAISTLTINELLREISKAEVEVCHPNIAKEPGHPCVCRQADFACEEPFEVTAARLVEEACSHEQPQSASSDPKESVPRDETDESNEIIWKLKSNEHGYAEFQGFLALKCWVEHCAKEDTGILISLDGNEWKSYVEILKNLTVSANSAIEAFKMSRNIEDDFDSVGVEGSGKPDQLGNIGLSFDEHMVANDPLFSPDRAPSPEYQREAESAARYAEADLQHQDGTGAVSVVSSESGCFKGDPASLVKRTEPATEQPAVSLTEPSAQENVLWKLKGDKYTYNFSNFVSLRKWADNLPNSDMLPISIDGGKTWKAYGEVMAIINASDGIITPIKAFDCAHVIEIGERPAVATEIVETGTGQTCACGTTEEDLKIAPHLCDCGCGQTGGCKFPVDSSGKPETPRAVETASEAEAVSTLNDYRWKLIAPDGVLHDFCTLESLSLWVKNWGLSGKYSISSDGNTWTDYDDFMAKLEPAEAFTQAVAPTEEGSADSSEQSIELDSQEVSDETPGEMELLDDEVVEADSEQTPDVIDESLRGCPHDPLAEQEVPRIDSDQADSSAESSTQPETSTTPVVTVVNEIIWKVRGERSERIQEFPGFAALQQGVSNLPDAPDKIYISLDGKEWKTYEQVQNLIKSGVRLRDAYEVATPVRFRKPSLNGIPNADLTKCEICRDTVELLTREDCVSRMIVPVAIHGGVLVVAVANPDDLELVAYLESKYPYSISRVEADREQIQEVLDTIYEEKS